MHNSHVYAAVVNNSGHAIYVQDAIYSTVHWTVTRSMETSVQKAFTGVNPKEA